MLIESLTRAGGFMLAEYFDKIRGFMPEYFDKIRGLYASRVL